MSGRAKGIEKSIFPGRAGLKVSSQIMCGLNVIWQRTKSCPFVILSGRFRLKEFKGCDLRRDFYS